MKDKYKQPKIKKMSDKIIRKIFLHWLWNINI